ncbi:MAG: peptide ligase PGM1-related protein, partial [Actinomycetota bacterium]|nr:peptide ligase PGM1-related protein [Actinomycetota bacterium]
LQIQAYGLGLARELSSHGVIGSFGVDFVIVPGRGTFLTEVNLRLGGTTHPFLMARFATEGMYDMATGDLIAGERPKFYVATDNWKSESFVALIPSRIVTAIQQAGLAFDKKTQSGVALHLLGATAQHGKLGATCIGNSSTEAQTLHDRALEVLHALGAGGR